MTLPRFSLEAEHCVVAAVLADPDRVLSECRPSPADFYGTASRFILEAAIGIRAEGGPVDAVSVAQRMLALGTLEQSGGVSEIAKLFIDQPFGEYRRSAALVADLARVRRASDVCRRMVATGQTCEDVSQWLTEHTSELFGLSVDSSGEKRTTSTLDEILADECESIGSYSDSVRPGVSTGIRALDSAMGGLLEDGSVYIVAGRPGMGKTGFAWQLGEAVAEQGYGVAFVSLEMTRKKLARRVLCGDTGIERERLLSGALTEHEWRLVSASRERLGRLPIAVDDQPSLDQHGVRAAVFRCAHRLKSNKEFHGRLRLVVVDYLQLMRGSGDERSREREVAQNSRGLCELAKQLECPVVVLSQLNRAVESRQDKRPLMSDLRESGAVEQDATGVLMLYRPDYYSRKPNESGGETAEIIIAKHRDGGQRTVRLAFDNERVRFTDIPTPADGFDDMFDNFESNGLDHYGRRVAR